MQSRVDPSEFLLYTLSMQTFVTAIHVVTCILLILVVLLQSGKGADISASLSGSSQTVFGTSGGANLFTRFTSVMAAIFFVTSLTLTLLSDNSEKSIFENAASTEQTATESAAPAQATAPAPAESTAETAPAAPESK